jgi:hypothetical protein
MDTTNGLNGSRHRGVLVQGQMGRPSAALVHVHQLAEMPFATPSRKRLLAQYCSRLHNARRFTL